MLTPLRWQLTNAVHVKGLRADFTTAVQHAVRISLIPKSLPRLSSVLLAPYSSGLQSFSQMSLASLLPPTMAEGFIQDAVREVDRL